MSSHREAPEISKDPVADNTDLYAFVSPDDSSKVTLIANYIPFEEPAGGPNFFQFGDDVLYEIKIDNNGDGIEDITYQFRFTTRILNPNTFLYNTGQITPAVMAAANNATWNMRQVYSVTKVTGPGGSSTTVLGSNLACPPVNIGPRSTPGYAALADAAIFPLGPGRKVFAGQREEAFNVDLGSIFDLGTLRPFQFLHLIPSAAAVGVDGTSGYNVHSIALQVPISELMGSTSIVGIWATASRQRATVRDAGGGLAQNAGPWVQVSRLGNPLINEVIIPLGKKDYWNSTHPKDDAQFHQYYANPELANLLPVLYPSDFPGTDPVFVNLAALNAAIAAGTATRTDLILILLKGLPAGVPPGFPGTFTGDTEADMLRLNLTASPSAFPNGRKVTDNVVATELRAVAGIFYNLIDATFTPDVAAGLLEDGTANEVATLPGFPYLNHPYPGYAHDHDHD